MDLFEGLNTATQWLTAVAALLAVGVAAYVVRTAGGLLGPLAQGVRWLFALPDDVAAGVAHGVRMLIWAAAVAALLWWWLG